MRVFNFLTFTILFIFCVKGFADVRPYMSLKLDGLNDLEQVDKRFLRKSALEIILASNEFEVLLNENSTHSVFEINNYVLIAKADRNKDRGYRLNYSLRNISAKKTIASVKRTSIDRKRLQLESRRMLYELFYGENFDLSTNELKVNKLRKELIADIEKSQNDSLGPEIDTPPSESVDTTDNKENEAAVKTESSKVVKEEDELKVASKKKKKRKSKKETAKISEFKSPNLDLRRNIKREEKKASKLTLIPDSFYAIGYLKETTNANNLVSEGEEVKSLTNLSSINITYLSNIKIEEWDEYFSVGGAFSSILSENPYGIAPRFSLYGSYNKTLFTNTFFGSVDIEYEKISFASISDRGAGLKGFANSTLWAGVGLKYIDEMWGKKVVTQGFYKKALVGSSDLSSDGNSVVIEGTKLTLDMSVNFYKKFGAGLFLEMASFSSTSSKVFNTEHQVAGVRLVYN